MIQGGAKGVYVTADIGVTAVTAVLLQWGIQRSSLPLHHGNSNLAWSQQFDQPEVHQLDQPIWCDLQVARLDVAVQNGRVLAVQVGESIGKLVSPIQHIRLGQKALLLVSLADQGSQVLAGNEVHYQVIAVTDREEIAHLGE